jgi:hypothetical protein
MRYFVTLLLLLPMFACSSGPSEPDAGVDAGVDAGLLAIPDLRFKWVDGGVGIRYFPAGSVDMPCSPFATCSQFTFDVAGEAPVLLAGASSFSGLGFVPVQTVAPGLASLLTGHPLENLPADFESSGFAGYVVVGLDSSATHYGATLAGVLDGGVSYSRRVIVITFAEVLQAWAAAQGAQGLVTTALCPSPIGGVYVTAFGRDGDSNRYDVSVVHTALDGLETQVNSIAASGYFITAMGRDGTGVLGNGGYILVGRKVQGSMVPRSASVVRTNNVRVAANQLFSEGYAVVGYILDARDMSDAGYWLIGER